MRDMLGPISAPIKSLHFNDFIGFIQWRSFSNSSDKAWRVPFYLQSTTWHSTIFCKRLNNFLIASCIF